MIVCRKQKNRPGLRHPVATLCLAAFLSCVLATPALPAAPVAPATSGQATPTAGQARPPATPQEARQLARNIVEQMEQKDEPATTTEYRWVRKEKPKKKKENPGWWERFTKWLDQQDRTTWRVLMEMLAVWSKYLVLLLVALGLGAALLYMKGRGSLGKWFFASQPATNKAPDMLFGLDIAPESLPDSPADASLALFNQGRTREALSLLYRAALSRLVHDFRVPLNDSMTELECGRAVAARVASLGLATQSAYFGRLTHFWMRTAYGHEPLEQARHQELAQGFREAFG